MRTSSLLGHGWRLRSPVLVTGGLAAAALAAPGLTAGASEYAPGRLLAAGYALTGPAPSAPRSGREAPAALRAITRRYVLTHPGVPGVTLSATSPTLGVRATVAAGRVSFAGRRALGPDATFRTASVTKPFTAAAVLRLVEDRRLALDARLDRLLPASITRGLDPPATTITVRELLQHTSGLYDYGTDPDWLLDVTTHPHRRWTPEALLDVARTRGRAYGPPGRAFHYSDTGYVLLGLILERVTGRPLAAAYRQLLPFAGLHATHLEGHEAARDGQRVRAHQYLGPLDTTGFDPSFDAFGGGGLVSDAGDLDRFARAVSTGRVFHRRRTAGLMRETVPAGGDARYGLGIGLRRIAGHAVWFHFGFFGAFLAYVPALDLSLGGSTNQNRADPAELVARTISTLGKIDSLCTSATRSRPSCRSETCDGRPCGARHRPTERHGPRRRPRSPRSPAGLSRGSPPSRP